MKRRAFLAALPAVATAWSFLAIAEERSKLPVIGFLGSATPLGWGRWVSAFLGGLRDLGWADGSNLKIEYRWAEGRSERYPEIAAEFVRLKVDLIVTVGSAVAAAKSKTATIPIVFAVANDPVGSGLVASLSRPGGNVTGVSNETTDLAGKQVEFLRATVPRLARLGIMANVAYAGAAMQMEEVQAAASGVGLDVIRSEIRSPEDIAPAVDAIKDRADALYVCPDSLVAAQHHRIGALALSAHLPAMTAVSEQVAAGFLLSYGPSYAGLWRRAATYADKILRGAKPADLPVQQPTKFELVINLNTAKTLGLTVPHSLLARADEVIE